MRVLSLKNAPKVPFDLDGRIMFSGEKTEIIHLQLQAEEVLPPHSNPLDCIFYCIEGDAELIVGEEKILIKKDDCIFIAAVIIRSWINTGKGILRLLVVKQKK